jgi:hypothetical protein
LVSKAAVHRHLAAIATAIATTWIGSGVVRAQPRAESPSQAPAAPAAEEEPAVSSPHPPLAMVPASEAGQATPTPQAPAPVAPTSDGGFSLERGVLNGYVSGSGGLRYRGAAVPRDRYVYGTLGTVGALIWGGEPYEHFSYVVHFGASATVPLGFNVFVQEASMMWRPTPWFNLKAGHIRVPFTFSHLALVTTLMFPTRASPSEAFLAGADDGVVATLGMNDERLELRAGLFNGASLGLLATQTTRVAPLLSAFLMVQPLGKMPEAEIDSRHGPFRFGLVFGGLATRGQLYDQSGYKAIDFSDYRLTVGLRAALAGVFVQGELLRRVATDDYAGRPLTATGIYGEASYFVPITEKVALAPMARIGSTVIDESFAPRKTTTIESGLALYPRADLPMPSMLRILVEYLNERRVTEDETAHAVIANFQLVF